MAQEFNTPVGRIMWGNPRVPQKKKDDDGNIVLNKEGKEVLQWVFGIGFLKADFDQYVRPYLEAEARAAFPNGTPDKFSWKFKDGDGVDNKGKPYAERNPDYRGRYILTVSTEAFAPEVFIREANNKFRAMEDNEVQTGYHYVVSLIVKNNGVTDPKKTPGLYVNPKALQFVAYGEIIVGGGADPDALFGNTQYAIPAGASATPIASTATAPGMAPSSPAPTTTQQPPAYVNQQATAPATNGMPAGIPPATNFVTNAAPPAAPAAPSAPPPPAPFPPVGWVVHPENPAYFWNQTTNEVIAEAELRARGR